MNTQLVVFDLAGTTVHDNRDVHRALQKAFASQGIEISVDEANNVMGIPKPVAIRKLLEERYRGMRPITESWISEIHRLFVLIMKEFYCNHPDVKEKSGVSETFSVLRAAGIKVAVDTGFDREITNPLLDRLGWRTLDLIDCSITSDEVPRGRPYPDMIFRAMSLTGVNDPKTVAKVGDTPSDLMEGKLAGCQWVIGITTGAFSRKQLELESYTHLIDQIPDVLRVIDLKS